MCLYIYTWAVFHALTTFEIASCLWTEFMIMGLNIELSSSIISLKTNLKNIQLHKPNNNHRAGVESKHDMYNQLIDLYFC